MEKLWFLWKIVKYDAPWVKFALYHMDEKWFDALSKRSMENVVTYIGLDLVEHYLQSKIHERK